MFGFDVDVLDLIGLGSNAFRPIQMAALKCLCVQGRREYLIIDSHLFELADQMVIDRLPGQKWNASYSSLGEHARAQLVGVICQLQIASPEVATKAVARGVAETTKKIDYLQKNDEDIPVGWMKEYARLCLVDCLKPFFRNALSAKSSFYKIRVLPEISVAKDALVFKRRPMQVYITSCHRQQLEYGVTTDIDFKCGAEDYLNKSFCKMRLMRSENVKTEVSHSLQESKNKITELLHGGEHGPCTSSEFAKNYVWQFFISDLLNGLEDFYLKSECRRRAEAN